MGKVIKSSQVRVVEPTILNNGKIKESKGDNSNDLLENKDDEYEKIINIAKQQAEDIVNQAILEAGTIKENVIKDAEEQLEKVKKQAYEESYELGKKEGYSEGYTKGNEEGYQNGYNEGKDESEILIEEANTLKREYLEEKEKTLNSIESDVINLVTSIVEKILNQKVEEDIIIDLVLKGLESLNSRDNIRILVSDEDFKRVDESKEEILSQVSLIENLEVAVDSNFKKGDCVVESSKGNVDVSVGTQIKNVEEELKSLLDSE